MKESLKIENLTKTYGKSRGVEDINLDIEKGTVYGFIGPNGAGKSTTIKCIMNLINKNSGNIYIEGNLIGKGNDNVKEKIGYLPSEIHLYDDLKVKDMLMYSASFYKKDCSSKIKELVKRLEIDISKKVDELSLGNLKKVGIALALMHDPDIIIMDEATSGLDPLMQEVFYEILEEEKKNGKTIFFSSHILSEVKRICDKVAIIKNGKIVSVEDIDNLSNSTFLKGKVKTQNVEKIIAELKLKVISENENEIEFVYSDDINSLLQVFSKYKIDKLTLEEPSLEEIFIHYYK